MSYKIAVASSDGKVINQHFGRSESFLVFEVQENGEWSFHENRENNPPCNFGEHHEEALDRTVQLLSDCQSVLVSQIGQGAVSALRSKGIEAYEISDYIDNALNRLITFENRKKTNKPN